MIPSPPSLTRVPDPAQLGRRVEPLPVGGQPVLLGGLVLLGRLELGAEDAQVLLMDRLDLVLWALGGRWKENIRAERRLWRRPRIEMIVV